MPEHFIEGMPQLVDNHCRRPGLNGNIMVGRRTDLAQWLWWHSDMQ